MITRIQQDRKKCRDNNGTVYTIQDILRFKNQKIDTNVYVWGANRADKQSIRFKRGKSDSAGVSDSKAWKMNKAYVYNPGSNKACKIQIVFEDSSSADKIIEGICNTYAKNKKINLSVDYIQSGGIVRLYSMLACDTDLYHPVIVIYDSGVYRSEMQKIMELQNNIKLFNQQPGRNIIGIQPLCIEEMCMQYAGLIRDVKNLQSSDIKLIQSLQKYRKTGDIEQFRQYDIKTCTYSVNGENPISLKKSNYISRYKKIKTEEQYIVDRLAEMTYGKPYQFVKKAQVCWYSDCFETEQIDFASSRTFKKCRYDERNGQRNPNSIQIGCNNVLTGFTKIWDLLRNQLFAIIYDQIDMLLNPNYKPLLPNGLYKDMIIR